MNERNRVTSWSATDWLKSRSALRTAAVAVFLSTVWAFALTAPTTNPTLIATRFTELMLPSALCGLRSRLLAPRTLPTADLPYDRSVADPETPKKKLSPGAWEEARALVWTHRK